MARNDKSIDDLVADYDQLSRKSDISVSRYAGKRKSRSLRHGVHVALATVATLVAVVAVLGVAAWAYVHSINSRLKDNIDPNLQSSLTSTEAGSPFYMLLLGIDKDEGRAESSEYGSSDNAYRSDSIMLARIDPQNKKATLVSIHRDTLVDLGENGQQKINAAYSIGGAAYATQVISQFAGVPISHYAEVDMDGMAAVVNAVGGVTVDLPVPVRDPEYTGLDLPAGEQTLDGETAALLCRARHAYDSYGDGDLYRAANQRSVITAVVKKVLSSDPVTMASTVTAMADMVSTDMDVSSIVTLATQFSGMNVDSDIMSGMEPTTSLYKNDTWYELCDTVAWQAMMKRVDQGLSPYDESSKDATSSIAAQSSEQQGSTTSDSAGSSTESSTPSPNYGGSVLVLNASTTNGVAGSTASQLNGAGFSAQADTAGSVSDTTRIIYNGNSQASALGVAETLGLDITPEKNNGSYASSVDVVIILGADRN